MAQAIAVVPKPSDRTPGCDQQSGAEAVRSLEMLAAAVLRSERPWQEFHRALIQMPPTTRGTLRSFMWRGTQEAETILQRDEVAV
jgi:hypothetical protein